jgi:uncharacterized membrane protein YhaH (DUF805 family)
MTTVQSAISSQLSRRAGWYVIVAWLLFLLTILACLTVGVGSAINAFYHPQHEWANYERAVSRLLEVAFGVAVFAALASSIALAVKWRTAASSVVALCWIGLVAGGAVYLGSIDKGPQYFDRYAGQQHFRIPWQYGPSGSDKPTPNGITLFLCLDSFLGRYETACTHGEQHQVSIYPPKLDFMGGVQESSWQRHRDQWKPAGIQNGHQAYIHSIPAEGGRSGLTIYYFRLTNSEGKLLRAVECFERGNCEHYAMVGRYLLFYTAPRSAFPEWDAMDRKLTALADTWAVPARRVD